MRLLYTCTDENNKPAFRYFYTINENTTWELRGLGNVKYKEEEESSDEAKHYSAWKSFQYQIDLYT